MFGQDNQGMSTDASATQPIVSDASMPSAMPTPYIPAPMPMPSVMTSDPQSAPMVEPTSQTNESPMYTAPEVPSTSSTDSTENSSSSESVVAAASEDAPQSEENSSNDLMEIKKNALQQLSPLVGKLDQTPEEKFHTTMMMIQASDNQDLVKDAFEAAQKISDEKEKAQALLDVVNEINYFTQKSNSTTE